jgi:hypothetical protein
MNAQPGTTGRFRPKRKINKLYLNPPDRCEGTIKKIIVNLPKNIPQVKTDSKLTPLTLLPITINQPPVITIDDEPSIVKLSQPSTSFVSRPYSTLIHYFLYL